MPYAWGLFGCMLALMSLCLQLLRIIAAQLVPKIAGQPRGD